MREKEDLGVYLNRILDRSYLNEKQTTKRNDATYIKHYREYAAKADLETLKKEYRTFLKSLNLSDERGGVTEELFLYFHEFWKSVNKFVNKKRGEDCLLEQLNHILSKSDNYYRQVILPKYQDELQFMDPSEAWVYINDIERVNSVTGEIRDTTCFLNRLNAKWEYFYRQLYETVGCACNPIKKDISFRNAVDQEIAFFQKRKREYYQTTSDDLYDGTNENPYKNLYIYCLLSYIKDFYILKIPEIDDFSFPNIYNLKNLEDKKTYSLQDVANVYAEFDGRSPKLVYDSMKKEFRKLEFMKRYKTGKQKSYAFNDLLFPIISYHYFRNHGHNINPQDASLNSGEYLLYYLYYPMYKAKLYGNSDIIEAYIKYIKFVEEEFSTLLNRVDDSYLYFFIDNIIVSSTNRLGLYCIGAPPAIIEEI